MTQNESPYHPLEKETRTPTEAAYQFGLSVYQQLQKETRTPIEVAFQYGITVGTLANWRSQKIGPRYYKLGARRIIYFQKDLDAWAKSAPVNTRDSVEA